MLLLTSTSDIVRVVTGSAADIEVHADWIDLSAGVVTPGRTNTASITTATTTTVVGSPAASTQRNVKAMFIFNNHASVSSTVAVEHTDGTTAERMFFCTLGPSETLLYDGDRFVVYDINGAPKIPMVLPSGSAVTAQIAAHSADTYYGANFDITNRVKAGSFFRWTCLGVSKTAGTATPTFIIRTGTAGAIGDTARATTTLGVQTAVVDQGMFEVVATFRVVGASAVIRMDVNLEHNLLITGFATTPAGHSYGGNTGASFDSTPAATKIGLSVNPGTSGAWVVESCVLDAVNLLN